MKRVLALCLLLLCLSSCASLLEREYTVSEPHMENPPPQTDAAYRVETYPALRSALLSYVEEGMEEGLLRFPTTYPGNLSVDLEKARRQLLEEDPLGNYAVADVSFHTSKIIAYYEVELTFTYKVDKATLGSLPRVGSQKELSELLGEALESGREQVEVYLTGYPQEDALFFEGALDLALEARAGGAPNADALETEPPAQPSAGAEPLPRPVLAVELYPGTGGERRVAVLALTYPPPEEISADGEEEAHE